MKRKSRREQLSRCLHQFSVGPEGRPRGADEPRVRLPGARARGCGSGGLFPPLPGRLKQGQAAPGAPRKPRHGPSRLTHRPKGAYPRPRRKLHLNYPEIGGQSSPVCPSNLHPRAQQRRVANKGWQSNKRETHAHTRTQRDTPARGPGAPLDS